MVLIVDGVVGNVLNVGIVVGLYVVVVTLGGK